jgi:hypothetical protein
MIPERQGSVDQKKWGTTRPGFFFPAPLAGRAVPLSLSWCNDVRPLLDLALREKNYPKELRRPNG